MSQWPGRVPPGAQRVGRADSVGSASGTSGPGTPRMNPGGFVTPRKAFSELVVHSNVMCDLCHQVVKGIRYKCMDCSDFDICQPCVDYESGKTVHSSHFKALHTFRAIPQPEGPGNPPPHPSFPIDPITKVRPVPTDAPAHQAFCDVCKKQIVGTRHRCLDCPDYDMCGTCVVTARTQHPFSHQFSEIKDPKQAPTPTTASRPANGAPVVNTPTRPRAELLHVRAATSPGTPPITRQPSATLQPPRSNALFPFSSPAQRQQNNVRVTPGGATAQPARAQPKHGASCDLCRSTIVGARHKCLVCPDFDTCSSCFTKVASRHPKHKFVKFTDPAAIISQAAPNEEIIAHHAQCDECKVQITGVRFKCIHPECPDYDLCENCEAHPIPIHPTSHPLVKLREHLISYLNLKEVFEFSQNWGLAPPPVKQPVGPSKPSVALKPETLKPPPKSPLVESPVAKDPWDEWRPYDVPAITLPPPPPSYDGAASDTLASPPAQAPGTGSEKRREQPQVSPTVSRSPAASEQARRTPPINPPARPPPPQQPPAANKPSSPAFVSNPLHRSPSAGPPKKVVPVPKPSPTENAAPSMPTVPRDRSPPRPGGWRSPFGMRGINTKAPVATGGGPGKPPPRVPFAAPIATTAVDDTPVNAQPPLKQDQNTPEMPALPALPTNPFDLASPPRRAPALPRLSSASPDLDAPKSAAAVFPALPFPVPPFASKSSADPPRNPFMGDGDDDDDDDRNTVTTPAFSPTDGLSPTNPFQSLATPLVYPLDTELTSPVSTPFASMIIPGAWEASEKSPGSGSGSDVSRPTPNGAGGSGSGEDGFVVI